MPGKSRPKRKPARTVQGRENQLVSYAYNLAEKQLLDGTASNQVMAHFLRAGSTREALERDRLASENEMLKAKVEALAATTRVEEMYAEALTAMQSYRPEENNAERDE